VARFIGRSLEPTHPRWFQRETIRGNAARPEPRLDQQAQILGDKKRSRQIVSMRQPPAVCPKSPRLLLRSPCSSRFRSRPLPIRGSLLRSAAGINPPSNISRSSRGTVLNVGYPANSSSPPKPESANFESNFARRPGNKIRIHAVHRRADQAHPVLRQGGPPPHRLRGELLCAAFRNAPQPRELVPIRHRACGEKKA